MAKNPLYNSGRIDAQNNGLTHDNKASNPVKKYSQGMNTFNNSYQLACTERFADISPFLYMDCVSRDVIPFRSTHKLSSYTLQSPMMDEIYKHKFYSIVPYRAILPNTWEIFYANPTKGDDVPDDVFCNVDLMAKHELLSRSFNSYFISTNTLIARAVQAIEFIISTELIFSTGSLLSLLKYNFWPRLYKSRTDNFDIWFNNHFVPYVTSHCRFQYEIQPDQYIEIATSDYLFDDASKPLIVSKHTFLDYLRDGRGQVLFKFTDSSNLEGDEYTALKEMWDSFYAFLDSCPDYRKNLSIKYDLSAVIAYQITCMSQATDPSIDYIFNANLFRETLFPIGSIQRFTYNGRYYLYETFSNKYLSSLWFSTSEFSNTCQKLFSFAKSLKFGDYFTQMRPEPYAVGDLTIPTNDGLDAIEITRKIVYQRFLNWNNRVGPKYEDYIKELTGMSAMPDPTEPSLITHSKSVVGSYQVENTGDAQLVDQNSVTTLLRDTNSGFEFDIVVSEPSILLGLTSYDMMRLYTRIIDRSHIKESRFDFFNHMLQYTGDQDIKALELDGSRGLEPIGYNTKDIHYKMQVSQATGGFIISLPSWAFTTEDTDNDMSLRFGINPEFIRNTNGDFDRFYSSLTGYSLGTYFHFILKYTNDLSNMQRAMDVAPDIL